jgi:RHS repeat-associated protein
MKPTCIVLTDAQQSFRRNLSNRLNSLPEIKIVAESCSGKETGYVMALTAVNRIASGVDATFYYDGQGWPGAYYVVTAVNSYGESGPSNTAQATSSCTFCMSQGTTDDSEATFSGDFDSGGYAPMSGSGGEITIQRSRYSLAGQTIAIRVGGDPASGNNGIFYYLTDHLGSTSVLMTSSNGIKGGSTTRYHPFGSYRSTAPTQTITDRNYTGHAHNDDLGLIYMNARYYVGSIGRFASADTLVPDPMNPQQFNRYTYTLNNPLRYSDPTGHVCYDHTAGPELLGTCINNDGIPYSLLSIPPLLPLTRPDGLVV